MTSSAYKPPVTIALLGVNVIVHIHPAPSFLGYDLLNTSQICIHPRKILEALIHYHEFQWHRILLAGFVHADDSHLYYNMISLLWKGVNLEKRLGSSKFLFLVCFSLLVSHVLLVILSFIMYKFLSFSSTFSGMDSCCVGFSAVLFSMKYVWNYISPEETPIMGFVTVPSKYAAWVELVLISLITPNASFIGHLAGILAGYLYLSLFFAGGVWAVPLPFGRSLLRMSGLNVPRYTYHTGTVGGSNSQSYSDNQFDNNMNSYPNASEASSPTHRGDRTTRSISEDDVLHVGYDIDGSAEDLTAQERKIGYRATAFGGQGIDHLQQRQVHRPVHNAEPPRPPPTLLSAEELRQQRLQRFDKDNSTASHSRSAAHGRHR